MTLKWWIQSVQEFNINLHKSTPVFWLWIIFDWLLIWPQWILPIKHKTSYSVTFSLFLKTQLETPHFQTKAYESQHLGSWLSSCYHCSASLSVNSPVSISPLRAFAASVNTGTPGKTEKHHHYISMFVQSCWEQETTLQCFPFIRYLVCSIWFYLFLFISFRLQR